MVFPAATWITVLNEFASRINVRLKQLKTLTNAVPEIHCSFIVKKRNSCVFQVTVGNYNYSMRIMPWSPVAVAS